MKRIIEIKKDVDEIERRISMNDTVELIRRNEKEKLKMNEMLMALLFKLDSIRGIDLGVRVCRRSVIKKVIALQERIDSIVPVTDQGEIQISGGQNLESTGSTGENLVEDGDQINESSAANFEQIISSDAEGQSLESTGSAGENLVEDGDQIKESPAVNFENGPQESSESKDRVQLEPSEVVTDSANPVADNAEEDRRAEETIDGNSEVNEFGANSEMKVEEEDHSMEDEVESEIMVKEEEIMETNSNEGGEVSEKPAGEEMEEGEEGEGRTYDNKRNRELLEKMMEDNEKMMNLMSQLCERNEKQMKMLNSLTQRVEQLEKAFVCHILRRKKGRHSP